MLKRRLRADLRRMARALERPKHENQFDMDARELAAHPGNGRTR
jgi:hypothetical protein